MGNHNMTKWLFLLLAVCATLTRATRIHDDKGMMRTLQAEEESVSRSFRVMMSPFHLVLAKTPEPLSDVEMDDLFGVLSSVIETYIRSQLEQTTETSLQYMFLRDMEDQYYQNNQTTLSFPLGGIAQFSGSDRISSPTLDEWTQYALEFILPGVLQSGGAGSAPLTQVEFSVYLTDRPMTDESIQNTPPSTTQQPSKNDIIIIVISVAATLVVVAVVAWLVSRYYGPRRRHDHTKDSSTSIQTAEARSPSSERPSPAQRSADDDRSEDSFTVHTEAGDSTAMKSIHPPHLVVRSEGPTTMETFQPVISSVRKDMLASSSWVENVPNMVATPPQVESVLAPSHFAASNEEHARRMRMHQQIIQAEAWDEEADEIIRFASAHEEEEEEEEGKHAVLESVSSF